MTTTDGISEQEAREALRVLLVYAISAAKRHEVALEDVTEKGLVLRRVIDDGVYRG